MINDENTPELEQEETIIEVEDEQEEAEKNEEPEKDWKAEALKYKSILERQKGKKEVKKEEKSDDFGYDVKAYLKASGIKAAEFDFVKDEMKAHGLKDIDSLLENDYFQAKLEKRRELSKTEEATPKGKRSGGVATDSVEYWSGKPIEEVPQNMRQAVVNAKLEKEKTKGVFYNS